MPESTVLVCRKTPEAIHLARNRGCDVLISEIDFGSNKEEGIRLAEEIKALNPQVNIIFVTAGSARDYAHQLVKVRYSGFLTKPFEFEELEEELGNLRYPQAELYQRG